MDDARLPVVNEPVNKTPLQQAMYDIADAMVYPVDNHGRVYDLRYLIPVLSYHLARAGCVIDPARAVIKKRTLASAAGVMEGAVEWVPLWMEDTIEDQIAKVKTVDDIDSLSPAAKAEFMRRKFGVDAPVSAPDECVPEGSPWRVETSIRFEDGTD